MQPPFDSAVRTQGATFAQPRWGEPQVSYLEEAAPPSTYAVAAVLEGEDGAALRLLGLTALRAVFIAPGFWVAAKVTKTDLDGGRIIAFSLAGSGTITLGMLGWYALKRMGVV